MSRGDEIAWYASHPMGILAEYETYFNQYQQIYGKVIVLYQNGVFYEMYGVDNEVEKVGLAKEMSDLLNLQLTRRSKAILENNRSNFLIVGFNLNQLDRYVVQLTEEYGYVVVIVEQVEPAPNVVRAVTEIIGPGTNIKYLARPDSSYLLSVYVEFEGQKATRTTLKPINLLTIGLAAIDVSTGQCLISQFCNCLDDENRAMDETFRLIQMLQPKEVIINSRRLSVGAEELLAHLDLNRGHPLVHCQLNQVPAELYRLSYQNEFLGTVYPQAKSSLLKPIEFLDMERSPTALIAFMLLLKFCVRQNETILEQIDRPLMWNDTHHLVLDNNCVNQLNITVNTMSGGGNHKLGSVLNLVDQTSTAMGKRLLKEKLLMPLLDRAAIEARYDCLDFFRQVVTNLPAEQRKLPGHQQHYRLQQYEPHLKHIADIERYHRKICLGCLQPSELPYVHTSYQHIVKIIELIQSDSVGSGDSGTDGHPIAQLIPDGLSARLNDYMHDYQSVIDLNEAAKYNLRDLTGSFFKPGHYQEIDAIQAEIVAHHGYFDQLAIAMSRVITPKSDDSVSHVHTQELGHHLGLTTARWNTFNARHQAKALTIKTDGGSGSGQRQVKLSEFEVIKNRGGKNCKIISPEMSRVSCQLTQAHAELLKQVVDVYRQLLRRLYEQYGSVMK